MYEYQAEVLKIVDGDTLHLRIDLGLNIRQDITVRLFGINAPEMSTPAGVAAKAYIGTLLAVGDTVVVHTHKDRREKYGRYLAQILARDVDVNLQMVETKHAVVYMADGS